MKKLCDTAAKWDRILMVSLTIGEYIGIHKDYAKAVMAIGST